MSDIAANDYPKYITTLWHQGRGRTSENTSNNDRCRLLATRIGKTNQYSLSIIEASYNNRSTLADTKANIKDGALGRILREHFNFSNIVFDSLGKLGNSLKLETRGYKEQRIDFQGKYSLKDVHEAMWAFRRHNIQATTGPLSFSNHVETDALTDLDVFSPFKKHAKLLQDVNTDGPDLSFILEKPQDRINSDNGWSQIANENIGTLQPAQ